MKRWRLRDPASIRWRAWDDGWVFFHSPSGDTHLIERPAAEALVALRDGPSATDALARLVEAQVAPEERQDLETALDAFLTRLAELGVVEALSP